MASEKENAFESAIFLPERRGGHPRYGLELAEATALLAPGTVYFLSSADLDVEVPGPTVQVERIFKPLRAPSSFRHRILWMISRTLHYTRRDLQLLAWLKKHPSVRVLHFQQLCAPWMQPIIARLAKRRGIALVTTVHNLRPHNAKDRPSLRERLQSKSLQHFDRIFVHHGIDLQRASEFLNVSVDRLVIIEHGLFIEECPSPKLEDLRLLLLGTLSPYKGLRELVEATRFIPDWKVDIFGRAVDEEYVAECMALEAPNVAFHVGFVSDDALAEVFGSSTASILPYTRLEAQSGALHLSLGCGRTVVVTPVGGMAEVVKRFGCGVVATGTSPREIADAILELAKPEIFASSLRGVSEAQETLSWKQAALVTFS
ncbi:MAG: glycosyltransferase family 4 protein, partial [Actinomycetota bacterium]